MKVKIGSYELYLDIPFNKPFGLTKKFPIYEVKMKEFNEEEAKKMSESQINQIVCAFFKLFQ